MSREEQLQNAINLIYEAVIDASLWPAALNKLADALGVAQIGLASFDHGTHRFASLSPRVDPLLVASYQDYWAFHDPIWPRMAALPKGELLPLDSAVPREDYAATAVYNEFHRKAQLGLSLMGAKLPADDQISTSLFAANPPDGDQISAAQTLAFKAALPHIDRAFRVQRLLHVRDLDQATAPEQLEHMGIGVILVDGAAKVLYANAWARALLVPGSGLTVKDGYLFSTDSAASLHQLIASCRACHLHAPSGYGGAIALRRSMRRPLRVTVTPLRARGSVAELPWLGLRVPVAMITISDPAMAKSPKN